MAAKDGRVQIQIENGKLAISCPESEIGSTYEEIAVQYNGDLAQIALNLNYLTDVLKVIDDTDIVIEFKFDQEKNVKSAMIIHPVKKSNITHIIMPMAF